MHVKDRKLNNGPNVPFGQGDTPIKEVLQLMRDNKWKFMAAIEFEYPVPEGSDRMAELAKTVEYLQILHRLGRGSNDCHVNGSTAESSRRGTIGDVEIHMPVAHSSASIEDPVRSVIWSRARDLNHRANRQHCRIGRDNTRGH